MLTPSEAYDKCIKKGNDRSRVNYCHVRELERPRASHTSVFHHQAMAPGNLCPPCCTVTIWSCRCSCWCSTDAKACKVGDDVITTRCTFPAQGYVSKAHAGTVSHLHAANSLHDSACLRVFHLLETLLLIKHRVGDTSAYADFRRFARTVLTAKFADLGLSELLANAVPGCKTVWRLQDCGRVFGIFIVARRLAGITPPTAPI